MTELDFIKTELEKIMDPEVPVLSIIDLGMVRSVDLDEKGKILLAITPTYSGCPATDYIQDNIREHFTKKGYNDIEIKIQLDPAWTTDWLSEAAHIKLKNYGIAPPVKGNVDKNALFGKEIQPACPKCDSKNTAMVSRFGSTACKALYKCKDCLEPFDYFKCH